MFRTLIYSITYMVKLKTYPTSLTYNITYMIYLNTYPTSHFSHMHFNWTYNYTKFHSISLDLQSSIMHHNMPIFIKLRILIQL
jgi:hypothetical protein